MDFLFKNIAVRLGLTTTFIFFSFFSNAQSQDRISLDTINNTVYIGEFKLKTPSSIISKYVYDEELNLYIYQNKIGDIDYKLQLTLTPEEYRNLYNKHSITK